MNQPLAVTQESFRSSVIDAEQPVLVDFWAGWCQPCLQMEPTINEIAADYADKVSVAKVNVEEERGLAAMFQVMSITALMVFKDGKKVVELHGRQSKDDLVAVLDGLTA